MFEDDLQSKMHFSYFNILNMQEISQNVPQFDDLIQDPKIPVFQAHSLCIQKRANIKNNKYSKCGFLKKMKSFRKESLRIFCLK